MKTFKYSFLLFLSIFLAGCANDGDLFFLKSLSENQLMATAQEVTLTPDNNKVVVLSLAWNTESPQLNSSDAQATNVLKTYLQVSTSQNFQTNMIQTAVSETSKAYTGIDLNILATKLNAKMGESNPFYFRVSSAYGNNMEPVYSNVVKVDVTPYEMDMKTGIILDNNMAETTARLYAMTDGVYTGFMGTGAWGNFYLKQGDGTIWGVDAQINNPFQLTAVDDAAQRWNMWFPGQNGCYYVTINTTDRQWTALWINTLNVSGDITASMTFDKSTVRWTTELKGLKAGNHAITLSGIGKLYDFGTGTDDSAAKDQTIGFGGTSQHLTFGKAETINFTVTDDADYTLSVDLSNPQGWTATLTKGISTAATPSLPKALYVMGIDDKWDNFNQELRLYNEDQQAYAGVLNINTCPWGYNILSDKNWESKSYSLSGGDAWKGSLVTPKTSSNIPAPADAGLYLINVSTKALTYEVTRVNQTIYYAGFNDVWEFSPLAATSTPGIYTADVNLTKPAPYGFKIYLDKNWEAPSFGASSGNLYYKADGKKDERLGHYTLTVNLLEMTYTFTAK